MKQITKMSRLTGQLEKIFSLLNNDFFDGQLPMPIITVIPSSKSYAHYTTFDAWQMSDGTGKREINIASGTLNRPIDAIVESMLHEMVHEWNDVIRNVQDTSRGGTYHNQKFREGCLLHGLTCEKTEKYGWSFTELQEGTLEWVLDHDELREIEMNRFDYEALMAMLAGAGNGTPNTKVPAKNNGRKGSKYIKMKCPKCGAVARVTKPLNLICGDCDEALQEEE